MKHTLALVLMVFGLVGCATETSLNIYSQPNGSKPIGCPMEIYRNPSFIKKPFDIIASIKVDDTGFTFNCGYEKTMQTIRDNACEVGADAVLIVDERKPDMRSTCYRADASMLVYKKEEVE